ncbi:MAG: transcription-repair coupling factor [Lentisphaeria bacterium]|nr:transcription-repair coupling factor [Lentisphaeria bacterium]
MSNWKTRFKEWAGEDHGKWSPQIVIHEQSLAGVALARLLGNSPDSVLLVAASDASAVESLSNSLALFKEILEDKRPIIPIPDVAIGRQQWIPENEASRSAALQAALNHYPAVFVASAQTLLSRTLSPKAFAKKSFTLKVHDKISMEELAKRLVELDYDNEFEVNIPGEFARRGGILDVFSPLYSDPVRLEFWGDEIDSMRFFSASTQRSTTEIPEFKVTPRGAAIMSSAPEDTTFVHEYFDKDTPVALVLPDKIEDHLEMFSDESNTLDDWQRLVSTFRRLTRIEEPPILANGQNAQLGRPELDVAPIGEELFAAINDGEENEGLAMWHWQQLSSALKRWHDDGYELVACCTSDGEIDRLKELLVKDSKTEKMPIAIEQCELPMGMLFPSRKLALRSDQELFGRQNVKRRRRLVEYNYENTSPQEFLELEEGSLAVHLNYGICRFHGVKVIDSDGEKIESIELEFADDSMLYVPLDQSALVTRYIGGSKHEPELSKLGGVSWIRKKDAAEHAAWDLAAELIRMEAMRASAPGIQLKSVPDLERSFASSFQFDLTPDQEEALKACFQDMENEKPMDRLLCGDVGYGKTEVALRASFRAVVNDKQVAVLVPTTVLAQQHYQTFLSRFQDFGVTVEMLSRFRSPREQKKTLQRLAEGKVDIIIGTHRLLSKDIRIPRLGLLVIDEEQRFGVKHKQRLKALRASLDVLTMTATPIPRTLYMSLSGLRNLSTIMTAPTNRLAVSTIVANYDKELIKNAITREIERGGQVFFLYNRVQTIEKVCDALRELVPQATFAVGHGQMDPEVLEGIMTDFVAGKIDVLVSTTIIESGIDIPNANTIIIDRADRFGLSELYQLRGRVGRYFRQAYAYMLLPPMGSLPSNARERMAAIRRFTHLGAGFRLAMKDLEIRGAGNLLGQEQSGHIAAVGFDLYCQLLKDSVARLQKQQEVVIRHLELELDMVCNSLTPVQGKAQVVIPREYIEEESARIGAYRHFQSLKTTEEIDNFGKELQDRFGPLPRPVQNLLLQQKIDCLAREKGLVRLSVTKGRFVAETPKGLYRINDNIPILISRNP